jgi:hypothetical protein
MAVSGRTLTIYLAADTKKANKSVDGFGKSLATFAKVGAAAAAVAVGILAVKVGEFVSASLDAAEQAKVTESRLRNVTKQMGLTKGEYKGATQRVLDYAGALSTAMGIEDDTIIAIQTKLATFGNLTKSINDTGGAFDRATRAAFDLASAGFGTAEGNAIQLGKALNDPIKGLASLAKSGVTFTDAEKERIKTLVNSNEMGKAQAEVLKAIETQVGGTAEATATAKDKMAVAWGEMQESVGKTLLPTFESIQSTITTKVMPAFQKIWETAAPKIKGALEKAATAFNDFITELGKTDFSKEKQEFANMATNIGKVGDAWSTLYDTITGSKSEGAAAKQHSLIGIMKNYVAFMDTVVGYYTTVWTAILGAAAKVWTAIQWTKDRVDGFNRWSEGIAESVRGIWYNIGSAIVSGFKAGLGGLVSVSEWAVRTVNGITSGVKGALGIQSPSKVFIDIGGNIVKGFEIGLSGLKGVKDSVAASFKDMAAEAQGWIDRWLTDAKDKLAAAGEDFRNFAAGVKDSIVGSLQLTANEAGGLDQTAWDAQIKAAKDWAAQLALIAANPAYGDSLVTMLAGMAPEAGIKFAQSLTPAMVMQLNADLIAVNLISEEAGEAMAARFKQQGVDDAQATLDGIGERIQEKLDWLYAQGRKMGLAVSKGYRDATESLLASGAPTPRSDASAKSAASTVNVTVQAGIGNPIEIARTIEGVLAAKYARTGIR